MRKIAVKRLDGGVSIIVPTDEGTSELLMRDALAVEGYVSHREIDDNQIPEDRYFRNAWTDDFQTKTIDINSDKALEIKKNKLRILRAPKLEALDIEYIKAIEKSDGELQATISDKKQVLRDVTLNLPADLIELKNYMPQCLI